MSKWKCEICGDEFENYHAQGFDNIIYCPLCYFKEKYKRANKMLKTIKNQLQQKDKENERLNNIINELKWKPIEEYDKGNYDWVLVKYFDGDYECVPCVAEKRFGKWHSIDEKEIQFEVKYFFDMQQLDKLQELKGDSRNE